MNEQPTFKAGDEVYCPSHNTAISKLIATKNVQGYPVAIQYWNSYTESGCMNSARNLSDIFHATPENKLLLEALYKCEFESPKLKGSDLTRKLLSEGKHVLCYLSVHGDGAANNKKFTGLVVRFDDNRFTDGSGSTWFSAVPCNDYANLVDGVLTLKSEQ
jgi:hypothetical protein